MDCDDNENPWTLFKGDDKPSPKICHSIIDNRFPNYFRKSSSLVTCNFCKVILLNNQTQQHFKIHHNKKIRKKFSKFKIPFNAVEGYDLICEIRRNKLTSVNTNRDNANTDLFKLNHKTSDNNFPNIVNKMVSKIVKNTTKPSSDHSPSKISTLPERSSVKINECIKIKTEEDKKIIRNPSMECKIGAKIFNRKMSKRSVSVTPEVKIKRLKSADLKLNIRVNSEGLLSSSIKNEIDTCSNIFDRISHFCDSSVDNKSRSQASSLSRGKIKQSGFDESYGCAIFSDQFNNSILIDDDKDEPDDFDCCESSLSNDSAYFSLPHTTTNSVTTPACKLSNLCDTSVAPPLVTSYHYSNSTNKVSYCTNGTQSKVPSKSASLTMHVTKNSSQNSLPPSKSTVKHRFYVSGHGNQTIIDTLKKKCNENVDINFLIDNENVESRTDVQTKFDSHSPSKGSQDHYLEMNKPFHYQSLKYQVNARSYTNGHRDIADNRFWNCFEERGLNINILIPKRLRWTQNSHRKKSGTQLYTPNSKPSPKHAVSEQKSNVNCKQPTMSKNPLLTSYTIDANNNDHVLQSDILTSEIVLDYQFPDRNQMSFQQRLLERGVISQRDIARSQRCLSFNINSNSRKGSKAYSIKPNGIEGKGISATKNYANKAQLVGRASYNVPNLHPSRDMGQVRPAVIHQPKIQLTNRMSQDMRSNSVPIQVVDHRRQTWCEDPHLTRIQNVSILNGQCLSQNSKYINSTSKSTVSPSQSRKNVIPSFSRTAGTRNTGAVFRSTSPNSSMLLINNSSFNSTAQNTPRNDSSRNSQQRKYVNLSANNINNRLRTSEKEFGDYHQSYDDFNNSSISSHPNYQTIYNPQIKFASHSSNLYSANFEL